MKVNKYNKCSGGGGTTCNLEDKRVTPSMENRDENNLIVVEESEGYDGLSRVVIDPQTIYNEGVNGQKSKLETINITENGTYTKEDGYNHIEVNVNAIPKINVKETGLRFGSSTFTEVPEWADFDGITDMESMFGDCYSLRTVPQIDTSTVTNMDYMFYNCRNLRTIPLLNTSNVTNMNHMFSDCSRLETIPQLNTSNVTNMSYMFNACDSLQTIPLLNTSKVTDMSYMFAECFNLQTIPSIDTSNVISMENMFYSCRSLVSLPALNVQNLDMPSYYSLFSSFELPNLINFGGLLNLKCSLTNAGNLKKLPNLARQSCINVLNGLYDFTGNGETPDSSQGQLKVHQNFLDAVGEEISIGTNKGWTITV